MRIKRRAVAALSVLAAGALLLTGCSGTGNKNTTTTNGGVKATFNAAVNGVVNTSTKGGGTLKLLGVSDCDSWDPARTYYGYCLNLQRTMSRTLVNYSKVNGTKFELAPDLATDLGTHNADYTEWKYTLKPGLKYSTGKAITPKDVKYAVERSYAVDVITGGPGFYFTDIIKAPKNYAGPYKSGDLPESAISTTSDTITFHLSKPFADFNYLLALPTSAPVPYKVEGGPGYKGATYTKKPVSSGPFVISAYTPQKSVTLTRNKYWSAKTDTIRKPLVDQITYTVDTDPTDIDSKLKAGTADAKADTNVGTTLQAQIFTNPKLKAQADDPGGPATDYLVTPASVIPNKDCRAAIYYATNKAALVQAAGGTASGTVALSMTPPGIPGYEPSYDPWPTGSDHTGDVAKAKAALAKCGKPNGFSTKFAYQTPSERAPKIFQAEQKALARVGIKITPATSDASNYYSTFIGSPSNVKSQGLGIIWAGWGADFPTMYGFYQNIVNGAAIKPEGNSNYGSINDPTVNKILDDTGTKTTEANGRKLNHALMATLGDLPYSYRKTLWWRSTRMTNVTCNNALGFGAYDWVNIGVGGA